MLPLPLRLETDWAAPVAAAMHALHQTETLIPCHAVGGLEDSGGTKSSL